MRRPLQHYVDGNWTLQSACDLKISVKNGNNIVELNIKLNISNNKKNNNIQALFGNVFA